MPRAAKARKDVPRTARPNVISSAEVRARTTPTEAPPPPNTPLSAAHRAIHASNQARIIRWRSFALTCACIAAGGVAFYGGSLYVSTSRGPNPLFKGPLTQSELTSVYDRTASSFDADVGLSEWLMGITSLRKRLVSQCRGDVLEVSSGTARNLGYYRFAGAAKAETTGIKSLTLVDISEQMVEQGRRKWEVLRATSFREKLDTVPVRFFKANASGDLPPPPPLVSEVAAAQRPEAKQSQALTSASARSKQGYDTIVQTMGLCSTDAPAALLQNMSSLLDTSNPEARILLIEHGRSYYDWLNRVLDTYAAPHADQHGCWWNRDIGEIVQQSQLEVVRQTRKHFGTTWVYELRRSKQQLLASREAIEHARKEVVAENSTAVSADEGTGLSAWLPRWTYEKICKR